MTGIMWEGIPIEELSREKLYEVISHLMTEQRYWVDQAPMTVRNLKRRRRMDTEEAKR